MEFVLERKKADGYTPGELWVRADGRAAYMLCCTLELPTPIPVGTYKLALTESGRARRGSLWTPDKMFRLPEVLHVPGYTAIRIHAGNTIRDTEGCILVGLGRIADTLNHSRDALKGVMAHFDEGSTGSNTIEIKEIA